MILKITNEIMCETVASIMKTHLHRNRALDHETLDDEIQIHMNAPPIDKAQQFLEQSLDAYFS